MPLQAFVYGRCQPSAVFVDPAVIYGSGIAHGGVAVIPDDRRPRRARLSVFLTHAQIVDPFQGRAADPTDDGAAIAAH